MSSFAISTTLPSNTSTPAHFSPFSWRALKSTAMSMGSKPEFSANVMGITSIDSANPIAANCILPERPSAHSLSFDATSISGAPPPAATFGFTTTSRTTQRASWTARSASSTTFSVAPLTSIVNAFGFTHPSTKIHSSSPSFRSSTSFDFPRSLLVISFRFITTRPPVALASLSMLDSFTLRTATMFFLARKC